MHFFSSHIVILYNASFIPPQSCISNDEQFSRQDVLNFFLHLFANIQMLLFAAYFHHKNGYLTVGKPPYQPLVEEFLQGCEWNGIPRVDLNAPYVEGRDFFLLFYDL